MDKHKKFVNVLYHTILTFSTLVVLPENGNVETVSINLFSIADNPFLLLSKERVVKQTTFRTFAFEKHIVYYKIET